MTGQTIIELTKIIGNKYQVTYAFGSWCDLWTLALTNGEVTVEMYNMAKEYYGNLWNYVSD